jgi:sulfate/thiosulfate transport system ATP-binding protein
VSITLERITKHYDGLAVIDDLSLDIGDGEFFVLLGPSGSGKSTLLRAVAGLTGIDSGRIRLHGRDVTRVAARRRGVGLVFQNYALFRHMTVADNIEFALRVRHVRTRDRRERRRELLRLVALEGLDDRLPAQLSGGQQQRVAVARALAHQPDVLLLDEPFGALDAKIRDELRRTIRGAQRELGITTVLVTHDQEEAFAMADCIGIMNHGRLLETGDPHELYARPASRFVATFLGAANLILARAAGAGVRLGAATFPATVAAGPGAAAAPGAEGREVVAVVRPEEVAVAAEPAALGCGCLGRATVHEVAFTGALERLRLRLEEGTGLRVLSADAEPGAATGPLLEVTRTQYEQRGFAVCPGQSVSVGVRRVHVLP